ncbi:MAG: 4-carboxymuconolactone decarboxylase [Pseudomonadota bacterium]
MPKQPSEKFAKGMDIRRKVLGNKHVDKAEANKTDFDKSFQELITENAWGNVWQGNQFSLRERSIVTLALLASLGHWEEFQMHVRASKNTGATKDDIREVLMHVAIYAGVPTANKGFKLAKLVFAEDDQTS